MLMPSIIDDNLFDDWFDDDLLLFTADFPQDSKKHAEHSFWSPVQRAP